MDLYYTSFKLGRYAHSDYQSTSSGNDPGVREAIDAAVQSIRQAHTCNITFAQIEGTDSWLFTIYGGSQQVMAAKALLLRDSSLEQHRATIKVPRNEILDHPTTAPRLKPDVRKHLDETASLTGSRISVLNSGHSLNVSESQMEAGWTSIDTERTCELLIVGKLDSVDAARVRLLVMLDKLSGLHADSLEVDCKLLYIVAGRKRIAVQEIQEETATNIYYPSPLHGLSGHVVDGKLLNSLRSMANIVWITGDFFNVQRAKEKLLQLARAAANTVLSRDVTLLPRKLDWMLQERSDDLKSMQGDNGTFIGFPPIGSQEPRVTIYGNQRSAIQRTIRSLMSQAVHIYIATFWLLPLNYNALMPPTSIPAAQIIDTLETIASSIGCEAVYKNNCFEFHGPEHDVKAAVAGLSQLDIVKPFGHEIHFQIELANEHREFISGKKNGKINKIMQTSQVTIKFETFNEFNFLISLQGTDGTALQGLTYFQEELPAEISFHVPEVYHKRIIGVGGKSIQKIMKKYGTFVKFSNAEEYAALGGYLDNDDNVLARTPTKNAMNLENLKNAIMELVNPKDKDFVTERVEVPRRYHRSLLGESSIFIRDIEKKTGCRIRFPDRELALDYVDIFGPEAQVHFAADMLLDHVSFEAEMTVPPSNELPRVINTPQFADFVESIKRDTHVTVVPFLKNSPEQSVFKFHCQRSNAGYLATARDMLESYLLQNNIRIYQANSHRRADSLADAFPHFNSRVLSTAAILADSATERRPVRLANSTPDVMGLFSNTTYAAPEQTDADETSSRYSSVSYRQSGEYWPPAVPGRTGLINGPRTDEDALKRGSDSLLEAKLKDYTKPRQQANPRAKSLDLTALTRINEGSPHVSGDDDEFDVDGEEYGLDDVGEYSNVSPASINGNGTYSAQAYPEVGAVPSRMSAPAGPPGRRPQAVRMGSGLADDFLTKMTIR